MFFSIFLYSLLKSSYLIYQEVISTLFPAFANLLLNLLLALLHNFKDDKLRKFIFQPYRFSGHLHFRDLSFMSRYSCRMFLLIISSFFLRCLFSFSKAEKGFPVLRARNPPPVCIPLLKYTGLSLPPFIPNREEWREQPHPATFGTSLLLLSASLPTPFSASGLENSR